MSPATRGWLVTHRAYLTLRIAAGNDRNGILCKVAQILSQSTIGRRRQAPIKAEGRGGERSE